jgi:tetratricopeptide (TPR) repeat protein
MRLLERDTPLCTLEALLGRARDGAGALVFVSGEAGIGKTALLRRFVAQVCPPVATWWGSCDPLQTPTALGPILEIVRQMAGRARQLDFDQPRVELFSALLQLLAERPAVVVIEDLHWADEATLDWLRYLGRRIDRTRTLLVTSYRDDELSPTHPLRVLLGDLATQRVPRLALAPLSVAAVGTLVDGTAIDAAVLHRQTGGNPFYVTEVVAIGGIGLPECVRDAVMARAARLAAPARALLDIAAVCGPRIEPWLLECLIGAEAAAVDECLALGVLRVEGEVFVFRHELARQAVLDSIAPWRRVALHRNVLQALEATHSEDLARLVHHAALGQLSDAVLRWAPAAAASAARHGAHREAAAHYGTALGHAASLAPEQRADLLERRSYECYLTADIAASVHARETALALRRQLGQRTREGDDVRWLSRLAWFQGEGKKARELAELAVCTLQGAPPATELAMAYSNKAQLHMLAQETADAVAWGERALALAEDLQATESLVHALNNVGTSRVYAGDASGWDELRRSLSLALEHDLEEHAARAYCNLTSALVTQRRYACAASFFAESIEYCNDRALDSWSTYLMAWRARSALEQGCWDDAGADARAIVECQGMPPVTAAAGARRAGHTRSPPRRSRRGCVARRGAPPCRGCGRNAACRPGRHGARRSCVACR